LSYAPCALLYALGITLCKAHLTNRVLRSGDLAMKFFTLISGRYEEKHYDDGGAKQGTEYSWS
jgi:hypothetical protein